MCDVTLSVPKSRPPSGVLRLAMFTPVLWELRAYSPFIVGDKDFSPFDQQVSTVTKYRCTTAVNLVRVWFIINWGCGTEIKLLLLV